jgi:ornithine cyclodeaminase/alanine dehydrogenase-like protein (mu-crystallin family)
MTLMLNNNEIQQTLGIDGCLEAMETAYRELAASRAVNRPTSHAYLPHTLPRSTYSFKSVEGAVQAFGVLALRITSDIVREETSGQAVRVEKLPLAGRGQFLGLVELFSIETGELLAIMPDGVIQQMRVAVTSALAARLLCRSRASTMGLIGSGGQARAHFRALTAVLPIRRVRVFSPNREHREQFAAAMAQASGIAVEPVESGEKAVAGSDLVCSATNSSRPVMRGAWLEPGMHYNAIREFEVDETVFEKSDVVAIHTRIGGIQHFLPPGLPTDLPAVRRERPRDWSRYPEIGDLLVGRAARRSDDRQTTFFLNNVGTGVQFAAMGYCAYRGARDKGLGRDVPTEWFLQDIKP